MKRLIFVLIIALFAYPAHAEGDDQMVTGLVDKAIGIFTAQGKDAALKVCNASAGPLRKGAFYVFVVDFKGQYLAHPVQADIRGHDGWELQDAKGKFITQDFVKIAKEQGEGWSEYSWLRLGEAGPTPKRTYVKRVPGEDILIASGYYVK